MTREEARKYLFSSGFSEEQATAIEKAFISDTYAKLFGTTKNDLGVDCVRRKAVLNTLERMDKVLYEDRTVDPYKELLKECYKVLPPVTPQEPFKPMVEIDLYSVIKQKYIEREVLDKIKAEIKTMSGDIETIADVLQIIDKYKAESEVSE